MNEVEYQENKCMEKKITLFQCDEQSQEEASEYILITLVCSSFCVSVDLDRF